MVPAIAATANLVLYGALTSKTYPMMIMQIQVATSSSRSFIFYPLMQGIFASKL